jgi:membrane protein DedA with SNARE-associated domain
LQSQLFLAETREIRHHSILPSLLLVSGLLLGAASIPVALIAFALGLAQLTKLSMAITFLIAFGVGSLGSLMLSIIGWRQACKRMQLFPRSREELASNYRWIKSAFGIDQAVPRTSTNSPKEPVQ